MRALLAASGGCDALIGADFRQRQLDPAGGAPAGDRMEARAPALPAARNTCPVAVTADGRELVLRRSASGSIEHVIATRVP